MKGGGGGGALNYPQLERLRDAVNMTLLGAHPSICLGSIFIVGGEGGGGGGSLYGDRSNDLEAFLDICESVFFIYILLFYQK